MINIISKRYYFFALSAAIIIAGIIGYILNGGFNLDIQFEGGSVVEIQMPNKNFDTIKIENTISQAIGKKVTALKSSTINSTKKQSIDLLIINVASKNTLSDQEQNTLVDILRKDFGVKPDAQMTVSNIQPSIGREMLRKGFSAIIWASILIIIYIWWRFRVMSGLSAGVMAVLGLLHDAAIMLSVYTIFNIPLNESFIAAVLTILGYSMNDTIIVYDRIRENNHMLRKMSISELVNTSIIQTLARSINTVVTVLICVITVYIFAYYANISSIKEFSLPLIIGVASGCYSSIFVTCPLWVMWKQRQDKRRLKPAKAH